MPNSERVALVLTEAVVGTQIWQHGICDTMPDAEYERTKLAAVAVLELIARAVDWPRLVAEAEWRHMKLEGHNDARDERLGRRHVTTDVCGECLREALLAHGYSGHSQDWVAEPKVKRRGDLIDWPQVFAETIRFRRPSFLARLRARKAELAAKGEA